MAGLRMTTPRLLVLRVLLDDPARERYGLDLATEAGLEPGTIYPILVAFEGAGWLSSREEEIDVHAAGRPRRRYYLLTAAGVTAARAALAKRSAPRVGRLAW
ncbi:helix-turn-helix transcriptional regulator [Dactylosporangium sp. NPDC049742]|uniref:helix-turn-helix transcriptional regulator n=1 Tax=Dactylosporangium sp. NPDC049742 TaxID=3154737 RepID=UPI003440732D